MFLFLFHFLFFSISFLWLFFNNTFFYVFHSFLFVILFFKYFKEIDLASLSMFLFDFLFLFFLIFFFEYFTINDWRSVKEKKDKRRENLLSDVFRDFEHLSGLQEGQIKEISKRKKLQIKWLNKILKLIGEHNELKLNVDSIFFVFIMKHFSFGL